MANGRSCTVAGGARLQAATVVPAPMTGTAAPGCRLLFGTRLEGYPPPEGLPAGFRWDVGTIGCLAGTRDEPYLVTAGHVVAPTYWEHPTFPSSPGEEFRVGVRMDATIDWRNAGRAITPDQPFADDGCLMDVVAIPLPNEIAPSPIALVLVDDAELDDFTGQEGFVWVDRGAGQVEIRGTIGVMPARELTFSSDHPSRLGLPWEVRICKTVTLTLPHGHATIHGDSGAPVLARRDGVLHLLGFHFAEDPSTGQLRSLAVIASAALTRFALPPLV